MAVQLNANLPLEKKEETPDDLASSDQKQISSPAENAQISNQTDFQPSSSKTNDDSTKETVEINHLKLSKDELKSDTAVNDSKTEMTTEPSQPTTIITADIHKPHDEKPDNYNTVIEQQCNENSDDVMGASKLCLENLQPSTSCSPTFILKAHDTSENSNDISNPVINSSNITAQIALPSSISDESELQNIKTEIFKDVSNISIIQQEPPSAILSDINSVDDFCTPPHPNMILKQLIHTDRDNEDSTTDPEVSDENEIKHVSESNSDLAREILSTYGQTVPHYFYTIVEGLSVCGDSGCSMDSKPDWFDPDKFQLGQQVALKYFFGLQFAQMLSLMLVLNMPDGLTPLIFSGKSDTPFKAFKRYLSTALRVKSWYLDDIWDPQTEGYRNIKTVRKMHETIRNKMNAADPQELNMNVTSCARSDCTCPGVWSPLHDKLKEDFEGTCPYPQVVQSKLVQLHRNHNYVNQTDMAVTQFGFVGLFILYPSSFGAHWVTDEELEGFLFLWRCIGYLLGMEDKFNFCNGSLQVVKQRGIDLIQHIAKPSLRSITRDWEHMARCVTEGISYYVEGVSFEVSLLYLCNILGLHTPRLQASLKFRQKIGYYLTWFTFWFIVRIPGAKKFLNWSVRMNLKKAQTASPAWLREKEEKKYPFQESITSS